MRVWSWRYGSVETQRTGRPARITTRPGCDGRPARQCRAGQRQPRPRIPAVVANRCPRRPSWLRVGLRQCPETGRRQPGRWPSRLRLTRRRLPPKARLGHRSWPCLPRHRRALPCPACPSSRPPRRDHPMPPFRSCQGLLPHRASSNHQRPASTQGRVGSRRRSRGHPTGYRHCWSHCRSHCRSTHHRCCRFRVRWWLVARWAVSWSEPGLVESTAAAAVSSRLTCLSRRTTLQHCLGTGFGWHRPCCSRSRSRLLGRASRTSRHWPGASSRTGPGWGSEVLRSDTPR